MVSTALDTIRLILQAILVVEIILNCKCAALPIHSDPVEPAGVASGTSYSRTPTAHNQPSHELQYCVVVVDVTPVPDADCDNTMKDETASSVAAIVVGLLHTFEFRSSHEGADNMPTFPELVVSEDDPGSTHYITGKVKIIATAVGVVIMLFVFVWFSALALQKIRGGRRSPVPSIRHRGHSLPTSTAPTTLRMPDRTRTTRWNERHPHSGEELPAYTPSPNCSTMSLHPSSAGTEHPDHTIASPAVLTASPPSYIESQEEASQNARNSTQSQSNS